MLAPWKKSCDQPSQHNKKQWHYFVNKGPSSQSYGFSSSHVWILELDYKKIKAEEWCFWIVVLDKTLERLLDCKEIHLVHPKGNQSWIFIHRKDWCWNSNTFATWWEELTHLKEPWCWERLKEGGEKDDRGWDGWMASLTRWTWVWVSFRNRWWTGKPGLLQSMGLQRVGHEWASKLTDTYIWIRKKNDVWSILYNFLWALQKKHSIDAIFKLITCSTE